MKVIKALINSKLEVFIFFFFLLTAIQPAAAQQSPDDIDKSEYFDFWVGEWNLTWEAPDGSMEKGKNRIERILNGKVIKENFEATSGRMKGYIGKSYSVYNARTGEWKQTWVDNNGAYLDFTGKVDGDKRIFIREAEDSEGNPLLQRMVFYDIKPNSLKWNWERSTDEGKSWELMWKIAYQRDQ